MSESPQVFWGRKCHSDARIACFYGAKGDAMRALGCTESELTLYLDDIGVSNAHLLLSRIKLEWLEAPKPDREVQAALLPALHSLEDEKMQRGLRWARSRDDLFLYLDEPITTEFASYIASQMNLPNVSFDRREAKSIELTKNVTRLHTWVQVFESFVRRPVSTPEILELPGWPPFVVTSGSQFGLKGFVEAYRLFWLRFLNWNIEQFQADGGVTALDVGYINQLRPDVSLCGFILACAANEERYSD